VHVNTSEIRASRDISSVTSSLHFALVNGQKRFDRPTPDCCTALLYVSPSIHPHAIHRLGCPLSAAAKNLAGRERRWKWKVHTCTPLGEAYHCLDCYCLSSSSSNLSTNSISGRSTAGVCRLRLAQLYCSIRSRARHERRLADRMKMADCTPSHWSILFLRLFTANRKRSTPWGGTNLQNVVVRLRKPLKSRDRCTGWAESFVVLPIRWCVLACRVES
jgi:hypothetical protein